MAGHDAAHDAEFSRSVDEHVAHVRTLLEPVVARLGAETVALDAALGRVSADAIVSPVDLPLFRNAQMDGFAVRASDLPGALPVVGESAARAGEPPALEPGTAMRIMTGAPIPVGADAVVRVEETTERDGVVTIDRAPEPGTYCRERGSDVRAGAELVPAGTTLAARHLAVAAAAGIAELAVRARLRFAIITTGSELIQLGETPGPGQLFDSNGTAVAALVAAAGGIVASRTHVLDDHDAMREALHRAARHADVILTSGGISAGRYEVVRETLDGVEVGHVAMQPGGPQATAVVDGVPVVCFPGNPVSTQLSFEVFVAPIAREHAGLPAARRESRALSGPVRSVAGKRQYLRGRLVGGDRVALVSGAGSHLVAGLAASDALVIVPETVTELADGDRVEVVHL